MIAILITIAAVTTVMFLFTMAAVQYIFIHMKE